MGYTTSYKITITAPSVERRVELAKQIAKSSGYPLNQNKCFDVFKAEIDDIRKGSEIMSFEKKWWNPVYSFYGNNYDCVSGKYINKTVFELDGEECLFFECEGENDEDIWEAMLRPYSYSVRRASSIVYTEKESTCQRDEDDYKCTGCKSCCVIEPIF